MTDIKSLYDRIYSGNLTKDPKDFIHIYEEHKNLIEGAEQSKSNPDFDSIIRITSDYALSLSQYGSSRKSIPYLDKAIQLFKNSSLTDLKEIQMFEMLVWREALKTTIRKTIHWHQRTFSI